MSLRDEALEMHKRNQGKLESLHGSATPGEYAKLNSSLLVTFTFGLTSNLP
jgi:hypothetical protein